MCIIEDSIIGDEGLEYSNPLGFGASEHDILYKRWKKEYKKRNREIVGDKGALVLSKLNRLSRTVIWYKKKYIS